MASCDARLAPCERPEELVAPGDAPGTDCSWPSAASKAPSSICSLAPMPMTTNLYRMLTAVSATAACSRRVICCICCHVNGCNAEYWYSHSPSIRTETSR
eukprot:scaffold10228_cov111-Isochrysis_galbana.AAC.4